jgi:hypothetical protein
VKLPADQHFDGVLFVAACLNERVLHERFINSHGKYRFHWTRIGQG